MKQLIFSIGLLALAMTISPAECYAQRPAYHRGLNGNGSYYSHNRQGLYVNGNYFGRGYVPGSNYPQYFFVPGTYGNPYGYGSYGTGYNYYNYNGYGYSSY